MILKVTRNNLTLEDIPLDYRIWTTLGCSCLAEGKKGCEAWCTLNNGVLNETNWTHRVRCVCPEGKWIPFYGCNTTSNFTRVLERGAPTPMSIAPTRGLRRDSFFGYRSGLSLRQKIQNKN